MKLLLSAATIEGAEKLLNEYFYSTSYKIQDNEVHNKNGRNENMKVEHKKGRVRILTIN